MPCFKPRLTVVLTGLLLIHTAVMAEEVPENVTKIAPLLLEWGSDPILIEAVQAQNALGRTLDEIKRIDAEWIQASEPTPFMIEMQNNPTAKELKRLEQSQPYFVELFLMDDQGANVAMTNQTSDFWQGDEAKFTKTFDGGKGALHVGDVKFDSSAQSYLVQVSVPVMDSGKAIGALTIGIDLDRLEQEFR
ncbi:cache domain-containing protein [Thiorhodococcus fuscus]|uniref:Cache domain-containing protein n=1 Tax=Thiorhodococcus fuscus TaxID=527200 RepID=A0ABW4YCQ4_9GAMM